MNQTVREDYKIREIDPNSNEEISLVALRMRQTFIEVLGEEKGTALYSMNWLLDRVRWHLDPQKSKAKIFLIENGNCEILAQAIARIDKDENEKDYGYFSTVFVELNGFFPSEFNCEHNPCC